MTTEPDVKRWTAKRKAALIKGIFKGQTTISEAARQHDLTPSEIEKWLDDAEAGMDTSTSSSRCTKRMARPCWSSKPEKSWHAILGWVRTDRVHSR